MTATNCLIRGVKFTDGIEAVGQDAQAERDVMTITKADYSAGNP